MFRHQNQSFIISVLPALCATLMAAGCSKSTNTAHVDNGSENTVWKIKLATNDLNDFFDCLESERISLVSAHRGGTPENSLAGMAQTLNNVPAIMEVDVATSKDGVLFLMHDDTLDRTTTGNGQVSETNWAEINNLALKNGTTVLHDTSPPTLAEALAWAESKTILQIDFKRSTKYEAVIAEVKKQKATHRVIYIAYTYAQAKKLHRLHPAVMISLTIDEPADMPEALSLGIPSNKIIAWTGNTAPDEEVFQMLIAKDIEVIFGTLGSRQSIDNQIAASGSDTLYAEIARLGVDVIATDRPMAAHESLSVAGLSAENGICGIAH